MATKAELERQLANLKLQLGVESDEDSIEGDIVDGKGGLYLVIRDEAFEIRRVSISWHMMRFAKAQRAAQISIPKNMPEGPAKKDLEERRNRAGMDMMEIMLSACMTLIKPYERQRFEDAMDRLTDEGLTPGEFEEAIGNAIAAVSEDPKDRREPSHSSVSSENTSMKRVVNLSHPVTEEDALPAKN